MICCSKNQSLIFATRHKVTSLTSATTSTQLLLMHLHHNWCKLKHGQMSLLWSNHMAFL